MDQIHVLAVHCLLLQPRRHDRRSGVLAAADVIGMGKGADGDADDGELELMEFDEFLRRHARVA
jgi:hypothetical protein